jgi:hypothetical protein
LGLGGDFERRRSSRLRDENATKALSPPLDFEGGIRYYLAVVVGQAALLGSPDHGRRVQGNDTSVGAVRRVSDLPYALAPRDGGAELGSRLT